MSFPLPPDNRCLPYTPSPHFLSHKCPLPYSYNRQGLSPGPPEDLHAERGIVTDKEAVMYLTQQSEE